MNKTLYRKYRPQKFSDVYGQEPIVQTLTNEIKNEKIGHAYLFTGSRGTGKTSVAKILGKMLNCTNLNEQTYEVCNKCVSCTQINNNNSNDIIEIDAASNNGIDEIRELKSKINLVPSNSKYKIYIVDEVHMMTTQAFNALLKTLEEPPSHVVFILATTDPEKLPMTILSRCQRFDFKRIPNDEIVKNLELICKKEKINFEKGVLNEIAQLSEGGMRDALSILDQVSSYSVKNIKLKDVHYVNGTLTKKELSKFIIDIATGDLDSMLIKSKQFVNSGKNLVKITEELIFFLRDISFYFKAPNYFKEANNNYDIFEKIEKKYNIKNTNEIMDVLIMKLSELKKTNDQILVFELMLLQVYDSVNKEKKLKINMPKISKNESQTVTKQEKKEANQEEKEVKQSSNDNDHDINELKSIRINNALAGLNKSQMIHYIKAFPSIRTKTFDSKFNYLISMLIDGEIKAFGNNIVIMVFKDSTTVDELNSNFVLLDELFSTLFNINTKFVCVNKNEWEEIKDNFNKKKKEYKFIEEKIDIQKFAQKTIIENSEIADTFGDLVEIN